MRTVRTASLLALLLVAACEKHDSDFMIVGGGGGGGGGGGQGAVDASVDGLGSGGDVIIGEVCLLTDARQPDLCATTGVGGYTVGLDGHTAVTQPDGSFIIDSPTSSNLVWTVIGTDLQPSLMAYSAVHRIPVIKQQDYLDLANENSVIAQSSHGDVFVHVVHNGLSDAMVAATTTPIASYALLFDGTTSSTWTTTGTSMYGMVWAPGLATGTATVTLTPSGGAATPITSIPVGDQTLTWVTVSL